jgi:hypothetical protein
MSCMSAACAVGVTEDEGNYKEHFNLLTRMQKLCLDYLPRNQSAKSIQLTKYRTSISRCKEKLPQPAESEAVSL